MYLSCLTQNEEFTWWNIYAILFYILSGVKTIKLMTKIKCVTNDQRVEIN